MPVSELTRGETAPGAADGPGFGAPGFGVYVHWPFCAAKCPYCDFNSHVRHGGVDQARYAAAYAREIAHMRALAGPGRVTSVFFGGGTPSLMEEATVAAILGAIAREWSIAEDAEITLEANPTSVEAARFAGYRAAGVNRVSLGVQALDDSALARLGRKHTASEAVEAVELARRTFPRISFDMIYARPGQGEAAWRAELGEALALAADHLSLYQLTIEEGTRFHDLFVAGKLVVPEDDAARTLYDATQELCEAAGMPAYEVSNHARPDAQSRHNLVYWRYGAYAGIGPGAHGRLLADGARRAVSTHRPPEAWLEQVERAGHGIVSDEALSGEEEAREFLLMGLRLAEGIDPARYAALGGVALDESRIGDLEGWGLVERRAGRLRATREGRALLNSLVAHLVD